MTHDRPLLGILLMLGFCLLAPMGDSIAKVLGGHMPLNQLLVVRFGIQALILLPIVAFSQRSLALTPRLLKLTVIRTLLHIAGIGMMFTALRYLPIADAIAIAFVMPFLMLLLGKYVLGETVGPHRLGAAIVGFLGTLLVIQPNFAAVGPPALLPLGVAVVFALFMLVTRQMAKDVDPISLQAISGLMGSAVLIPVAILLVPDTGIILPGARDWALLIALGTLGTMAHLLMTWSLRFAPAATLAPMQYLEIPFATIIGWLVFRDLPNGLATLGIAVTIAAGLYVIARERNVRVTPPPAP
ncbi:DMT family transporter [Aliiroseovarius subalbicans]|uniref:DMT family transporter n=1 Tax=Aliiroseovarius subalbicans TaxID=2925840 RepID=UPI001F58D2B8|nr:DMT family transporter [Aliiroseovarius subalbicans]MCI2397911.1 DMT family transporter [Aliiroseovarius subalbicans]